MARPFRPTTWARSKRVSAASALPSAHVHAARIAPTTFATSSSSLHERAETLEPSRRVELPPDGLRDRCTSVVLRGQLRSRRPELNRPLRCGALGCHPHFTCLVVSGSTVVLRSPSAHDGTSGDSSRGSGGNRTHVSERSKTRPLQPVLLPTRASHPLESNQNLSGFSRARRPTTQEWDTSAARMFGSTRAAQIIVILFGCQRAAQAHLGSRRGRAHLGRDAFAQAGAPLATRDLDSRSRVAKSDCVADGCRPETTKGRLVSLGGPSAR